ncbi:hypothetical protein ZWY2020_006738 [Hordeum vulgare]|nr:hypothetical protein ZWY2020_006738 [Hordeum vulgare]
MGLQLSELLLYQNRGMDLTVAATLPDDLVVEILSRLPFKSFCRFKCVCKTWLAFSSNPNYHENLPKIPTGLFCQYQDLNKKATKLIGQPRNVEQIDGALSFLPQYPQLKLMDSCNGLVLCMRRSMDWSNRTIIYHFIVCNPATREWTKLPDTRPYQEHGICEAMLVFNPSCSPQFYVLNFKRDPLASFLSGLEVFSSNLSTWLVYDTWWNSGMPNVIGYPHLFIDGSLYLFSLRRNSRRRILVLNGFETMSSCIPPNRRTIKLPNDPSVESPNRLSVDPSLPPASKSHNQIPHTMVRRRPSSSSSSSPMLHKNLRALGPGLNPFAPFGMGHYSR